MLILQNSKLTDQHSSKVTKCTMLHTMRLQSNKQETLYKYSEPEHETIHKTSYIISLT